jgi:hypothetical protein
MQKFPGVNYPGGTGAFEEILINDQGLDFRNITIDRTAQYSVIPKFTLYGRQTASPYKYAPYATLIQGAWTNTTNATFTTLNTTWSDQLTVTTDKFYCYQLDLAGFIGVGTTILVPGVPLTLDVNSGGVLTFTGEVVGVAPEDAEDYIVLADGTELAKDVVIVLEEVDFTYLYAQGKDYVTNALYAGNINLSKINRYTQIASYAHLCQRLRFQLP